ncbi:hypothetical protein ES705_05656 [subsurface metagenome]
MTIENLIGAAESEILEWKSSLSQLNRIIETISAFSNTKGGRPPYKRVGKSTLRMSKDEYERSILEKHKDKLYFDSQICKEATLDDIDNIKVKKFLERASFERRLEINPNITPIFKSLEDKGLIKKGGKGKNIYYMLV